MATSQQWPSLAPEQQKLLLKALKSNHSLNSSEHSEVATSTNQPTFRQDSTSSDGVDPTMLDAAADIDFTSGSLDHDAFGAYVDTDAAFDFDHTRDGSGSADNFPDSYNEDFDGDIGEKRKSPDDDDEQGDAKRHEGDEKSAKKPGRKPLTSEPTTKRKAQNRAAQRAFRERKEKHLKDLELKVLDLEKASESANHENGLLRAQVDRLQEELQSYRKRVSQSGNGVGTAQQQSSYSSFGTTSVDDSNTLNDFTFDFPKFESLSGSFLPTTQASSGNAAAQKKDTSNQSSRDGGVPSSAASRSQSASNPVSHPSFGFADQTNNVFSPGFINALDKGMSQATSSSPDSYQNVSSIGSAKGAHRSSTSASASQSSASNAASPGNFSISQKGPSSSCCTSPESSLDSPGQRARNQTPMDGYQNGNIQTKPSSSVLQQPNQDLSFDWLAAQNGGQFDPVLFNDYREPQEAIIGGGDFTGGFFEDSFAYSDVNDPFFNIAADHTIPAPAQTAKPSLMDHVAACRDGKENDGLHASNPPQEPTTCTQEQKSMYTAHKIWNKLQNCPKFQSGDFDIDGLCAELSAKAKCTESGLQVPKSDVEAALWRLAGQSDGMGGQR